jgi:hypothetical protein
MEEMYHEIREPYVVNGPFEAVSYQRSARDHGRVFQGN